MSPSATAAETKSKNESSPTKEKTSAGRSFNRCVIQFPPRSEKMGEKKRGGR